MPSTPLEQNAPQAVGNASSAVETAAMAPDSSSRDGDELYFVSYLQHQLSCHDSFGSHIPNNLKNKIWAGLFKI